MFEKVRDMLAKQLNLKPEAITLESDVVKDLGADSLDVVELLISLEDDYGISIPRRRYRERQDGQRHRRHDRKLQ